MRNIKIYILFYHIMSFLIKIYKFTPDLTRGLYVKGHTRLDWW